jgi:micrococcal nuclease
MDEYISKLYHYKATVTRIVDADTLYVLIDCGFSIYKKEKLRLARIDAPEIRGAEKIAGRAATDWLKSKVEVGDEVIINTTKADGFGRYIAEVFVLDGDSYINISDELVKVGHAEYKEY